MKIPYEKWLLKHDDDSISKRSQYAIYYYMIALVVFAFVAILQLAAGILDDTFSIVTAAATSLADIGICVVAIIGFKFSEKQPDEKHPFGYARLEYMSGLIIATIIIVLGFELGIASFERMAHPNVVIFHYGTAIVMLVSVLLNFYLYKLGKSVAYRINSVTLKATTHRLKENMISFTLILIMLIAVRFIQFPFDAYVSLCVSVYIIYNGVNCVYHAIDPLLGRVADGEQTRTILQRLLDYPSVLSVHEIFIHNYGYSQSYVTAHVVLEEKLTKEEIHQVICQIEENFMEDGTHLVLHFDLQDRISIKQNDAEMILNQVVMPYDYIERYEDLQVVPSASVTYLLFRIVLKKDCGVSESLMKEQIQKEIKSYASEYSAAISVVYDDGEDAS